MAEQSSQSSLKGKRKRDPNMNHDEKSRLIALIRKYFRVIENKKTDAVSVVKKNEVWETIKSEFNALTSVPRNTDTLKNMWKNMKAEARKKAAEERQSQMKTGGGVGPVFKIDPLLMEVLELIQCGAVGLLNPFDSDGAFDNAASADTQDVMESTIGDVEENMDQMLEQETPVNGDWGEYSSSKLRTPKARILQELPHCSFEVDKDGHLKVANIEESSILQVPESEKNRKSTAQKNLQPLTVTPSITRSNKKNVECRKRPVLAENNKLVEAKRQAIASAEAHAAEEHQINMEIKKEQLKQERLKTACLLLELKMKKQQYLRRH